MVKICVFGSVHGCLDLVYGDVREVETKYGHKIDVVFFCGDLRFDRNMMDMSKGSTRSGTVDEDGVRNLNDFWRYYSGEKIAPYLTIIVSGNIEAMNYLQELPYGGWVAKNIYYLGYAGIVNICGLRIAGLSGIYKRWSYEKGHFEHPPFNHSTDFSSFNCRTIETLRMLQVRSPVDIVLSHEWPGGIQNHSDELPQLRELRTSLITSIEENNMGSPPLERVLLHLKPRYWFAAHINFKFTASVEHSDVNGSVTRFLGLDKCLPGLHYMQYLDIEQGREVSDADTRLSLDLEWLCILRNTNHLMSLEVFPNQIDEEGRFTASNEDRRSVSELFGGQLEVPDNFEMTAPAHGENPDGRTTPITMEVLTNPQNDLLCAMLGLVNPNAVFLAELENL